MSNIHHKEIKEEGTKKLLIRALEMLIKSKSGIILSGKKQTKINFSYGQIIDAMNQIATVSEKLDGITIKSTSTISKNPTYRELIEEAKLKRIETIGDLNTNGRTGNLELDIMIVEQENAALRYELTKIEKKLKTTNAALDLLKKDESLAPKNETLLSNNINEDKYKKILRNLLVAISSDYGFVNEPPSNGKAGRYYYVNQNTDEDHFICYEDELKDLLAEDTQDDMDLLK